MHSRILTFSSRHRFLSFGFEVNTVNSGRSRSSNKKLRENVTGKLILDHSEYYIQKRRKTKYNKLYGLLGWSFDTSNSSKGK